MWTRPVFGSLAVSQLTPGFQDEAGHFLHQNKLLELELSVQELGILMGLRGFLQQNLLIDRMGTRNGFQKQQEWLNLGFVVSGRNFTSVTG